MRNVRGATIPTRSVSTVEPARRAGVNVDRDLGAISERLFDLRNSLRRHMRIFLGKVHDHRADGARSQIKRPGDAGPIINNRAVDAAFYRRPMGDPAAAAEAEHADLPGAFGA